MGWTDDKNFVWSVVSRGSVDVSSKGVKEVHKQPGLQWRSHSGRDWWVKFVRSNGDEKTFVHSGGSCAILND